MATQLLRLPQVQERVGLSRTAIYIKASAGDFPSPVALGSGGGRSSVAWRSDEVQAWIEARPRVQLHTQKPRRRQ